MRKKIILAIVIVAVLTMPNWVANRILQQQQNSHPSLGALRHNRRFDVNNFEATINAIAGQISSNPSLHSAITDKLGLTAEIQASGLRQGDDPNANRTTSGYVDYDDTLIVGGETVTGTVSERDGRFVRPESDEERTGTQTSSSRYGEPEPNPTQDSTSPYGNGGYQYY